MQPIQHQLTQPIDHMQSGEIEYHQAPTLTYNQHKPIQHNQLQPIQHIQTTQPIEQMQAGEIEYNQAYKPIPYSQPHAITGDTDSQTSSVCEACGIENRNLENDKLKEIGFMGSREIDTYICVLCSTPTYFSKLKNQREHIR